MKNVNFQLAMQQLAIIAIKISPSGKPGMRMAINNLSGEGKTVNETLNKDIVLQGGAGGKFTREKAAGTLPPHFLISMNFRKLFVIFVPMILATFQRLISFTFPDQKPSILSGSRLIYVSISNIIKTLINI
jgi:hypothetical protein